MEQVLKEAETEKERKHRLASQRHDLRTIGERIAESYGVKSSDIWTSGKKRNRVKARSLLCYWAVRGLGMNMMELSRSLALSPSGVSQAVKRGEKLSREGRFTLL